MQDASLTITSVESLLKYSNAPKPIELPGWEEGVPFVCELRRSSLRGAILAGKVPNALLASAHRLYEGDAQHNARIDEMLKVMNIVVRDAMVNPTLKELEEAGIELTEEQYAAIYLYAQGRVRELERFRPVSGDTGINGDG